MNSREKNELGNHLSELKKMFAPGSGFGDSEARANAEFQTKVILAELQLENNQKLGLIQIWGFIFVIVQTALALIPILRN